MFRQQSEVNCNCSLFPQPLLSHLAPYRSPQRQLPPHSENKSKKSLKFHSSSRQRNIEHSKASIGANQNAKALNSPSYPTAVSAVSKKSQNFKQGSNHFKRNLQNLIENEYQLPTAHFNQRLKNVFEMSKEPTFKAFNQTSTRATSPLNPFDSNTQRTIVFNYRNQNQPNAARNNAVSPPPIHKVHRNLNENSGSTTLAGSLLPNSELRKKGIVQKSSWSRQSFDQTLFREAHEAAANPSLNCLPIQSNRSSAVEQLPRPITSSKTFQLSRLSEMMNEREEIESIYEGEKGHEQGGMEYSRVLISCKKLMQERNGVLMQSAQSKLFNFQERGKVAGTQRSGVFDQIQLEEH